MPFTPVLGGQCYCDLMFGIHKKSLQRNIILVFFFYCLSLSFSTASFKIVTMRKCEEATKNEMG